RPSDIAPGTDPRLEEICLKALEKAPAQRYQSGEEFGRALRAWLDSEPQALPPRPAAPRPIPSSLYSEPTPLPIRRIADAESDNAEPADATSFSQASTTVRSRRGPNLMKWLIPVVVLWAAALIWAIVTMSSK